jgi:nitronate monooxygenase
MQLSKLLGTKYSIIQAPIAGSDNPKLVAAASKAGALGSLGGQYRTPEDLCKAITEIRGMTSEPFAVNLFAFRQENIPSDDQIEKTRSYLNGYYSKLGIPVPSTESIKNGIDPEAQLNVLIEEKIPVFSFTLGLLEDKWVKAFRKNGTLVIGTATNVKEAKALAEAGVDAITAQGSEAGGHRGTFIGAHEDSMIGGFALIPQLVDAVRVPIIAAGAIMDGRAIAAALALGAAGVQLGTAFLTVSECPVNAEYKKAIHNHDADDTTITKVFSGAPARGIRNSFIEENADNPLLPFPYHNNLTRPIRKVANESGQIEYTNLWSGQGGRLAREVSAKELIETLVEETNEVLAELETMQRGW